MLFWKWNLKINTETNKTGSLKFKKKSKDFKHILICTLRTERKLNIKFLQRYLFTVINITASSIRLQIFIPSFALSFSSYLNVVYNCWNKQTDYILEYVVTGSIFFLQAYYENVNTDSFKAVIEYVVSFEIKHKLEHEHGLETWQTYKVLRNCPSNSRKYGGFVKNRILKQI